MSGQSEPRANPGDAEPIRIATDAAWKRHTQIEPVVVKPPDPPCPACQRMMPTDATVCVHCGFDKRQGYQRATGIGATGRKGGTTMCPKCGYDMTGLKRPICPECGNKKIFKTDGERRELEAREAERALWITPLVMIGVSAVVCIGYCVSLGNPLLAIGWFILELFGAAGAFVGYVVAAVIVGWTYSVWHTFLRLFAITMVLAATWVFIPAGFGLVGWIISVPLVALLAYRLLDLDASYAWIVAVLILVGRLLGYIVAAIIVALL